LTGKGTSLFAKVGDLIDTRAVNKSAEDEEASIGGMSHSVIVTRSDVSLKNKTKTFSLRNRYKIDTM
jgi:hypothetical protein